MAAFTDRPTSARGPDRRPGEAALIDAIRNGTIDRVLIWSVCRIGKSLPDLVCFMETCRTAGVARVDRMSKRIDTETSNGMSLLDLDGDDGAASAPEPSGPNSARSGSGPEFVDPIWTPANSDSQDREGQALPGDGQGSSRGGEVGRWDQPVIRVANRGVPAFNGRSLTPKAVSDLQYPMNLSGRAGEIGVQQQWKASRFCGTGTETRIAEIQTTGSKQVLRDKYGNRLGEYDARTNRTVDKYGNPVGSGNLLPTLLR